VDYEPRLAIGGWGENPALDRARLQIHLDALVASNVAILRAYPDFPRIYSGVVWYRSPEDQCNGCDDDDPWSDAEAARRQGFVDCEDAAAWLAAERIVRDGIPARVAFRIVYDARARRQRIHVTIETDTRRDGSWIGREDPALVLGMK